MTNYSKPSITNEIVTEMESDDISDEETKKDSENPWIPQVATDR